MRRHLSTALLYVILCSLVLSACGRARRTPQITTPVTMTAAPTVTRTTQVVTRTPYASQTPHPVSVTRTPIYPTHEPTETPTLTPFPASTPEDGPEAYRLKPWDYRTAFHLFDEAENIMMPDGYESLRLFYKLSMLEEIYLKMPEYKTDTDLLRNKADLKGLGNSYWEPYGLIHDHSVEPFIEIFERDLNEGKVTPTTLEAWVTLNEMGYLDPIETSNRLFDNAAAFVMKLTASAGRNIFIISKDTGGHFTVRALYPEWKRYWWDDETFQITDLNTNGRDEIAVTYNGWGTGSSHFCHQYLTIYEWNGSTFENLMADEFGVVAGTDYSDCLPVTFPPDPRGGQMIQYGVTYYTPCSEAPYQEILLLHWDGKRFQLHPSSGPNKPKAGPPDRCIIDWALDAGPGDAAISQMETVLANWPVEAEQEWGPAARDFLRFKLATWYLQREQVKKGLVLLREIRSNPYTPEYTLPAKAADTFLSTYETNGFYQAVQDLNALFWNEQDPYCAIDICMKEEMLQAWGYFEQEWEYGFSSFFPGGFSLTKALNWELKQDLPKSMEDLKTWLNGENLKAIWSVQGNMDGQGNLDWLVEVREEVDEDEYGYLFAFLHNGENIELVNIESVYSDDILPTETRRWQSFSPEDGAVLLNFYQVGPRLYAFRFDEKCKKTCVQMELNTWHISMESRVHVKDWKIEDEHLQVMYEGRDAEYHWDAVQQKFVPIGLAPELQEENIGSVEKAIYFDNDPVKAVEIINGLLNGRIWENSWLIYDDFEAIRPYALYLLGLAYEQSGDSDNAVRAYWQLWHEYPTNPYSIAAQSKLERR